MSDGLDFKAASKAALDEEATSEPAPAKADEQNKGVLNVEHPEDNGALSALSNAEAEGTEHPNTDSVIEVDGDKYTPEEIRRLRDKSKNLESEYTKKFQNLSEEKQSVSDAIALWEELENDPLGTVRKLHQRFSQMGANVNGLEGFKQKPQQLPAVSQDEEISKLVDERVRELLENDPRLKEVENTQLNEQLEAAWAEIEHQYDVSLTDQDKFLTLKKAEELNVYDLPFVFGGLLRQAEQIRAQRQNVREVSSGGGSRSTLQSTESAPTGDFNFKDAANAALAELGDQI